MRIIFLIILLMFISCGKDEVSTVRRVGAEVGPAGISGSIGPTGSQGVPGNNGDNGKDGQPVTITSYTNIDCMPIINSVYYGKVKNISSYSIFQSSDCSDVVFTFSFNFSSMMLGDKLLGVYDGKNGIKVIRFN